MVAAWLKALLFVAGGVTAAAGTAYVTGLLDPWLGRAPAIVAALPETPAPQQQDEAPVVGDGVPLPDDPATTEKRPRLIAPTFDILRVEPDGSVVIAGNAAPGALIDVMSGETVIASAKAGARGDFVAVLDDPLAPGDYQLGLRAISDDVVSLSSQTATVSIPDAPNGQVLALVDEPGAPSKLITVPEAPPSEEEPAAETPAEARDVEVAQDEAPLPAAPDEAEAVEEPAEQDVAEVPATEPATEGDIAVAEPQADEPEADEEAVAEPGTVIEAEEETPSETEIAALPSPEEPETAAPQPAPTPVVVVEAVEIEGDTVFVAGVADPGRTVRVYANALLLGDARVSEGGRFLIEAQRKLPVGDYIIRADLLDADGTVIARAAVPFEREPGESIAAVAPSTAAAQGEPAGEEEAAAAPEPELIEDETTDAPDAPVAENEIAVAPEAEAPDAVMQPETEAPEVAQQPETSIAVDTLEPASPSGEMAAGSSDEPDVDVTAAPPAAETEQAGESEVTAPKLQRVDGAVIIRRGDTLWRISRRVYGRGIRYSTIYLANQEQIRDPDRIWPGQVFSVPQETVEGEQADMEAIGEQAVSPDTESKIIR